MIGKPIRSNRDHEYIMIRGVIHQPAISISTNRNQVIHLANNTVNHTHGWKLEILRFQLSAFLHAVLPD